MPVSDVSENVYPVCAAIGPGLPFGIGAAVANSGTRKTVVLTGDGGFALNMTELWTAVQEKLDLAIIIMNDNGYGVIRQIQDALYGSRHFYVDLSLPNLERLAALAGIPFWRVTEANSLQDVLQQALCASCPTLIEVDVVSIGAIPPYFPYDQPRYDRGEP
jgi:acetolactate synthase-1/2/3 large subunit